MKIFCCMFATKKFSPDILCNLLFFIINDRKGNGTCLVSIFCEPIVALEKAMWSNISSQILMIKPLFMNNMNPHYVCKRVWE